MQSIFVQRFCCRLLLTACFCTVSVCLGAEDTPGPVPAGTENAEGGAKAEAPAPKKTVEFPFITVDREKKEVRVESQLSPGLRGMYAALEFLLISGTQDQETKTWYWDRDYESVFVTKADPNHIHVALMLAGLKPGVLVQAAPAGFSKDNKDRLKGKTLEKKPEEQQAALVDIFAEWKEGAEIKSLRAEKFIYDRAIKTIAADTPFAFTGSFFITTPEGKKTLAASETFVIASVFNDTSAVLNLPFFAKNAHWSGDVGMEINSEYLPPFFLKEATIVEGVTPRKIKLPVFHPVTLIFRPTILKRNESSVIETPTIKTEKADPLKKE